MGLGESLDQKISTFHWLESKLPSDRRISGWAGWGVLGKGNLRGCLTPASLPLPRRHGGQSSYRCGPLGREPLAAPRHTLPGAGAGQTVPPRKPFLLGSML